MSRIAGSYELFSAGVSGLVKKTLDCTVCSRKKGGDQLRSYLQKGRFSHDADLNP